MEKTQKYDELIEICTKTKSQDSTIKMLHTINAKCKNLQENEVASTINIKEFVYDTEKSVLKITIFINANIDQIFEIYNDLWLFWSDYSLLPPTFLHPTKEQLLSY